MAGEKVTGSVWDSDVTDPDRSTDAEPGAMQTVYVVDVARRRVHAMGDRDGSALVGEATGRTHPEPCRSEATHRPGRAPRYDVADPRFVGDPFERIANESRRVSWREKSQRLERHTLHAAAGARRGEHNDGADLGHGQSAPLRFQAR